MFAKSLSITKTARAATLHLLFVLSIGACSEDPVVPIEESGDTIRFSKVVAGARHSCGISTDGRARCWGFIADGALGGPRLPSTANVPLTVSTTERFKDITAGARHSCGLTLEGAVYCWGSAAWGRAATPRRKGTEAGFVEIVSTWEHACALRSNGQVACWGDGSSGQLGPDRTDAIVPLTVPSLQGITRIAAGGAYTCALDGSGAAWCWGFDDAGQLGSGLRAETCPAQPSGEPSPCALAPVRVLADQPFVDIVAGLVHACGLLADGGIQCWGDDGVDQLGYDGQDTTTCDWANGSPADRACARTPVDVSGGVQMASLARGILHTCGIDLTGTAYCWGSDSFGQIGSIVSEPGAGPETVTGGHEWASLTGGQSHSCGITTSGAAYCWGDNSWGQLGSTVEHTVRPVLVSVPLF